MRNIQVRFMDNWIKKDKLSQGEMAYQSGLLRMFSFTLAMCLMLTCMLSLSSCKKKEEEPVGGIKVYYLSNSETKLETRTYDVAGNSMEEQVSGLLELLATPSEKLDYKPTLGYGFTVTDIQIQNETLNLDVDGAYKDLPPTTEVLVRAALVKTFTQIEGINYVYMRMEGEPLLDHKGEPINRMSATQFIYNDGNDINTYELKKIKLYFANTTGDKLLGFTREKHYSTNVLLERFIVEELILGPGMGAEDSLAAINPDTKILGVTTKDGICYVNLDAGFLTVVNNVPTEVAIYSIVDSLTELSGVNQVQIQINGEVPDTFPMSVFERNLEYLE